MGRIAIIAWQHGAVRCGSCSRRALAGLRGAPLTERARTASARSGRARVEARRGRRTQPRELALRELARRGDSHVAQLRARRWRLPGIATPAGSRRSASTAGSRLERVAFAAAREVRRQVRHRASPGSAARSPRAVPRDRTGTSAIAMVGPSAPRSCVAPALQRRERPPAQRDALRARAGCVAHRSAPGARPVAGSTRASSACSAGQPSRAARASSSARTAGVRARQRRQTLGQRLEIEHRAAGEDRRAPARADRRRSAASASRTKRAAEYGCVGSMMSTRWCGTRARSAAAGLSRCRCPCRDRPAPNRR